MDTHCELDLGPDYSVLSQVRVSEGPFAVGARGGTRPPRRHHQAAEPRVGRVHGHVASSRGRRGECWTHTCKDVQDTCANVLEFPLEM